MKLTFFQRINISLRIIIPFLEAENILEYVCFSSALNWLTFLKIQIKFGIRQVDTATDSRISSLKVLCYLLPMPHTLQYHSTYIFL